MKETNKNECLFDLIILKTCKELKISYANSRACSLFNLSLSEIEGKDITALAIEDDKAEEFRAFVSGRNEDRVFCSSLLPNGPIVDWTKCFIENEKSYVFTGLAKEDALDFNSTLFNMAEVFAAAFWIESEGRVEYVNPAFEKIWQIKAEGFKKDPGLFLKSVYQQDADMVFDMLKNAQGYKHLEEGFKFRITTPEGKIKLVKLKRYDIPSKDTASTKTGYIAEDISEADKMEEELLESKMLLELFFDQTLEGHFFMMLDEPVVWNNDTDKEKVLDYVFYNQHITRINKAMLLQYGAQEKDFLGLRPIDFFKDNPDYGKSLWKKLFDEGKSYILSKEKKLNGEDICFEGYYVCLYDNAGRIIGHVGVQRDITSQKKLEAERARNEERYRSLVESQKDFVVRLDDNCNYLYANKSYCKRVGIASDEIIGKNLSEVVTGDIFVKAKDAIDRVKYPPYRERFEIEETSGNNIRWILWEGYGIRDEKSKVIEIQAVGRDITAEKTEEIQLKFTNDELEKSVEERSTALINAYRELEKEIAQRIKVEEEKNLLREQLYQSQKMEALGVLAGGVAHDFNNLMSVISGYTQLLMWKTGDDYEFSKDLKDIYTATMKASRLTSQLLLFSRQQSIEKHEFDLNECLRNLLSMIERVIGEDIIIELYLSDEECVIYADKGNIEQVIMNLVINARDAMPSGGKIKIATSLNCKNDLCDNVYDRDVKLTVTDSGCGIPFDVQSRIFEPFFTTKGPKSGTGLGLAVVYGIIKNHGGQISFESVSGRGTSFIVILPLQSRTENKSYEEAKPDARKGENEIILLVEDDEHLRAINSRALTIKGFKVISAKNYERALFLFKENVNKIDAVVSDVILPDGNGIELAKEMFKIKPNAGIVLTSGYTGDRVDIEEIKDDIIFIQKPYRLDALINEIKAVIKLKKDT
jgi:PAS domain S-box-containing protein